MLKTPETKKEAKIAVVTVSKKNNWGYSEQSTTSSLKTFQEYIAGF
jgi:hypothetical protein